MDLTTYEIISLASSIAAVLFALISVIIAIASSKASSREANKQIAELNRATRTKIAIESSKIEIEKFRLSMEMQKLLEEKKKILADPNIDVPCAMGPNGRQRVKLIDEDLERYDKLYHKMGWTQIDLQQSINNFK